MIKPCLYLLVVAASVYSKQAPAIIEKISSKYQDTFLKGSEDIALCMPYAALFSMIYL